MLFTHGGDYTTIGLQSKLEDKVLDDGVVVFIKWA